MSSHSFDRVEFIHALQEWCGDRFDPLVRFPGKGGFQNVAYLYSKDYAELIENGTQLMEFIQRKLKMPVVVFAEPLDRASGIAMKCDDWLKIK